MNRTRRSASGENLFQQPPEVIGGAGFARFVRDHEARFTRPDEARQWQGRADDSALRELPPQIASQPGVFSQDQS